MDNLTPVVPSRIAQLAAAFSHPEPMRRGSLCERRMKCGQGACACQHDPKAAHGPYFLLTQKVEGKTRSRYVSPEQAPVVRRQIESGRQFRERLEAYWEACERWADEQLEAIPVSAESPLFRPPLRRPGSLRVVHRPIARRPPNKLSGVLRISLPIRSAAAPPAPVRARHSGNGSCPRPSA